MSQNDFDGHVSVEMALAQLSSQRVGGGAAALGAVHGRGAVHHRRLADPGAQVHPELVQRVPELAVRGPALRHAHGRHALRRAAVRDLHQGAQDPSRVYV